MEQKFDFSQADPLFVEVARFVVENNRMAMGSPLERKFEIGFNRSRRIQVLLARQCAANPEPYSAQLRSWNKNSPSGRNKKLIIHEKTPL